MSKILTLTGTGLAGLVLGAGIGIAAAGDTPVAPAGRPAVTASMDMSSMDMGSMDMGSMDMTSMHAGPMPMGPMDGTHASMRGRTPAETGAQHDEVHAATAHRRRDGDRPGRLAPEGHGEHHSDEQEG